MSWIKCDGRINQKPIGTFFTGNWITYGVLDEGVDREGCRMVVGDLGQGGAMADKSFAEIDHLRALRRDVSSGNGT